MHKSSDPFAWLLGLPLLVIGWFLMRDPQARPAGGALAIHIAIRVLLFVITIAGAVWVYQHLAMPAIASMVDAVMEFGQ